MKKALKIAVGLSIGMMTLFACKESKSTTVTSTVDKETTTTTVAKADPCANSSFASVNALITERCTMCHQGSSPAAGIDLTNNETIKGIVSSGKFLCVAKAIDCKQMPPKGPKLTNAEINMVNCWAKNGMKD